MITTYDLEILPDVDGYLTGLRAIQPKMKPEHFRVLQAQYSAPDRTATASELAESAAISGGHVVVNRLYGGLGHMFCDATGFVPEIRPDDSARWWAVWSVGRSMKDRGFLWEMRTQVAEALRRLEWVTGDPIPEEEFRRTQEERTAQALRSPNEVRLARLASAPTHAAEVPCEELRSSLEELCSLVCGFRAKASELQKLVDDQRKHEGHDAAEYLRDHVLPVMTEVRALGDELEGIVADDLWPLPKYREMLFIK